MNWSGVHGESWGSETRGLGGVLKGVKGWGHSGLARHAPCPFMTLLLCDTGLF